MEGKLLKHVSASVLPDWVDTRFCSFYFTLHILPSTFFLVGVPPWASTTPTWPSFRLADTCAQYWKARGKSKNQGLRLGAAPVAPVRVSDTLWAQPPSHRSVFSLRSATQANTGIVTKRPEFQNLSPGPISTLIPFSTKKENCREIRYGFQVVSDFPKSQSLALIRV